MRNACWARATQICFQMSFHFLLSTFIHCFSFHKVKGGYCWYNYRKKKQNSKAIFIMIRPINQLISLAMQRQCRWNLKRCWSCIQRTWVCSLSSSSGTYWLGYQSLKPHPGSFHSYSHWEKELFPYVFAEQRARLPVSRKLQGLSVLRALGGPESTEEQRLQRQDCWGFGLWVFLFLLVSECQREVEAIT